MLATGLAFRPGSSRFIFPPGFSLTHLLTRTLEQLPPPASTPAPSTPAPLRRHPPIPAPASACRCGGGRAALPPVRGRGEAAAGGGGGWAPTRGWLRAPRWRRPHAAAGRGRLGDRLPGRGKPRRSGLAFPGHVLRVARPGFSGSRSGCRFSPIPPSLPPRLRSVQRIKPGRVGRD